jgi:hypothetical protein
MGLNRSINTDAQANSLAALAFGLRAGYFRRYTAPFSWGSSSSRVRCGAAPLSSFGGSCDEAVVAARFGADGARPSSVMRSHEHLRTSRLVQERQPLGLVQFTQGVRLVRLAPGPLSNVLSDHASCGAAPGNAGRRPLYNKAVDTDGLAARWRVPMVRRSLLLQGLPILSSK